MRSSRALIELRPDDAEPLIVTGSPRQIGDLAALLRPQIERGAVRVVRQWARWTPSVR